MMSESTTSIGRELASAPSAASALATSCSTYVSLAFSSGPTIGMDALKTAFANIYQSMDAIDTYKAQALDAMSATVASLKVEIDKSQAYLNRVRAAEVREAGSGADHDVLKLGDPPTA